jgi:hypothetical protein
MTLGEWRQATKDLDDSTYIVEQHNWPTPFSLELGSYLNADVSPKCIIIGHGFHVPGEGKNVVLYRESQ